MAVFGTVGDCVLALWAHMLRCVAAPRRQYKSAPRANLSRIVGHNFPVLALLLVLSSAFTCLFPSNAQASNDSLEERRQALSLLTPDQKLAYSHRVTMILEADRPFWNRVAKFSQIAATGLNMQLEVLYGDGTPETLSKLGQQALSKDISGLIYMPIGIAGEELLRAANQRHVPVVTIHSNFRQASLSLRAENPNWVGHVGMRDENIGQNLLGKMFEGETNVKQLNMLLLAGPKDSPDSQKYVADIETVLKEQFSTAKLTVMHTDWLANAGAEAYREALKRDPEINAVVSVNASMALAVLEQARLEPNRPLPNIGSLNWRHALADEIQAGNIKAGVAGTEFEGAFSLVLLFDYLNGVDIRSQGSEFLILPLFISPKNYNDYYELLDFDALQPDFTRASIALNKKLFLVDYRLGSLVSNMDVHRFLTKLTPKERAFLREHPVIRVGVDSATEPMEFIDKNGVHRGLMADYLAEISGVLPLVFKTQAPGSWQQVMEDFKLLKLDMLSFVAPTFERKEWMRFTSTIEQYPAVIVTRLDEGYLNSLEAVKGRTVAVVDQDVTHLQLLEDHPDIAVVPYKNIEDALNAVKHREVDVAFVDSPTTIRLLQRPDFNHLQISATSDYRFGIAMGVRKDWPELQSILNKALAQIPADKAREIQNRWLNVQYDVGIQKQQIEYWGIRIASGVALVLVLFGLRNRELSKQINRRIEAETLLNQSMMKFQELFESAVDACVIFDKEGTIIDCNSALVSLFQFENKQQVIGNSAWIYYSESGGEVFKVALMQQRLQRVMEGGQIKFEAEFVTVGNAIITAEVIFKRIELNGEFVILASYHDLAERKLVNALLERERDLLKNVLGRSPIGVWICINGVCRYANEQMTDMAGLHIGQSVYTIFTQPDEYRRHISKLDSALSSTVFEIQIFNRRGEPRDVLLTAYHTVQDEQNANLCWALDITDDKVIQQELAIAKDAAEAASRAKSDFLANMSHELRTPMNAVLGMSYLVLQTELSSKQRDYIGKVHQAAGSLLGILNDILDFSKIEADKMKIEHAIFDLDDVLSNLANVISFKAEEKNIVVVFDVAHYVPRNFYGDSLRLGQILINYCNNALKFSHDNNRVIVRCSSKPVDDEVEVTFCIEDFGIGIPEHKQDILFGSFEQVDASTSREYGGTGLGLAICKRLAHLMGGEVWCESEFGVGSRFYLRLTLKCADTEEPKAVFKPLDGEVVKLVGLHPSFIELLSEQGEANNIRVETAEVADMIAELQSSPTRQLLICDYSVFDGELLDAVNANEQARVLLICNMSELDAARKQTENGDRVCLMTKPFTPIAIGNALLSLLGYELDIGRQSQQDNSLHSLKTQLAGAEVLLVEDNELNQELAVELLHQAGINVTVANNGLEAVEWVAKKEFDGVLMDCQMPVLDGYDATRRIRAANFTDLPILAMTAHAMAGDVEKALAAGMNDQITKPVHVKDLYAVMARWITPRQRTAVPAMPQSFAGGLVLPQLDGLNLQIGLALCDRNEALYSQLLNRFVATGKKLCLQQQLAWQENNATELQLSLHSLKGVSANVGATEISRQAGELEQILKTQGSNPSIPVNFYEPLLALHTELQCVVSGLELWQQHRQSAHAADEFSDEALSAMLVQLELSLKEYNTNALELVAKLIHASQLQAYTGLLKQLKADVEGFDFDKALARLQELNAAQHS